MSRPDEAREMFRGKEKLNCAQAVLRAYQDVSDISHADIDEAKTAGGGKAEGGVCGSIYAAGMILNDPEKTEALQEEFEAIAGSRTCKEVRKLKKITCRECVGITADLLEKYIID